MGEVLSRKDRQEIAEAVRRDPSLARVAEALGVGPGGVGIGDQVRGTGAGYYGGRIGEVAEIGGGRVMIAFVDSTGHDGANVSAEYFARHWELLDRRGHWVWIGAVA